MSKLKNLQIKLSIRNGNRNNIGKTLSTILVITIVSFLLIGITISNFATSIPIFSDPITAQSDIKEFIQSNLDEMSNEFSFKTEGLEMAKLFLETDLDEKIINPVAVNDFAEILFQEQIRDLNPEYYNSYTYLAIEMWQIGYYLSYSTIEDEVVDAELTITYNINWRDGEDALTARHAVEDHARAFLNSQEYLSKVNNSEKLKAINSYICSAFQYDYRLFIEEEKDDVIYSAYQMINDTEIEGRHELDIGRYPRGVCQAYTMYAYIMLREAGFANLSITGNIDETTGQNSHVWNLVQIDSNWYHIDFTWNDPITEIPSGSGFFIQDGEGYIFENYLLKSDEKMQITHSWNESMYPAALYNWNEKYSLSGEVIIIGNPQYAELLVADIGGINPDDATIFYSWKRSGEPIDGATNYTYKITREDIDNEINVTVTGTGEYSGDITSLSVIPTKADGPAQAASPLLESRTSKSITLKNQTGYEYKIHDCEWQKNATFDNLDSDTQYSFYQRYSETETHFAGEISEVFVVRTSIDDLSGTVEINGINKFGETLIADITAISPDEATFSYRWKRNGNAISGAVSSTYSITQADIGNEITVKVTGTGDYTGDITSDFVVPIKADGPASNIPTLLEKSWNKVVLEEHDGFEYKMNSGEWQTDGIFDDLDPNRKYEFYQRVAETDTNFAGDTSENLLVRTDKRILTGTVVIIGTIKYGGELTADVSGLLPIDSTFEYQWYNDGSPISGATKSTYIITQEDIDKEITVTVEGTGDYTGNITSFSVVPTKANGPASNIPTLLEKSWNKVVLQENDGYEYKMNSSQWQTSGVFDNLTPGKEYLFYQRVSETDTHFAGDTSEVLVVQTDRIIITGTVEIIGTIKFSEVLTADITGVIPDDATVSFRWRRNGTPISGAINHSYTISQADIGNEITVTVTGTGDYTGDIISMPVIPTKADSPKADIPILSEKSWNKIILQETVGYEYKINDGEWQTSGTFLNLDSDTQYSFYQRYAETATHFAGEISDEFIVRTSKGSLTGTVAIEGVMKFGEVLMADITSVIPNDATISYLWKRNGNAITGAVNSEYTITQEDIGNPITVTVTGIGDYTGDITSVAVVPTKADGPLAPPAPTLASKTHNSVTLNTQPGYEYRRGTGEWQISGLFTGLNPNTEYSFYSRIAQTPTNYASLTSDRLLVRTLASEIKSNTYNVNQSTKTISKISERTTVSSFLGLLNEDLLLQVYNNGNQVSGNSYIGTGMKVRLMNGNTIVLEYDVVVTGDVTGNGRIEPTDYIRIRAHLLGTSPLTGLFNKAADIDGNGKLEPTDYIRMRSHLLGRQLIEPKIH